MPKLRMPLPILATIVAAPIVLIGATWWMASALVPACTISEQQRLPSPDETRDLVVFSTLCEDHLPNTRAALVPSAKTIPLELVGFIGIAADTGLAATWNADGSIDVTLPEAAPVFVREDEVDGIAIQYREPTR